MYRLIHIWSNRTLERPPLIEQIDYLRGTGKRDPEIDSWLLMAPHLTDAPMVRIAGTDFTTVERGRRTEGEQQFVTYNDPKHRQFAEHISGKLELAEANLELQRLTIPKRAVMIFYAVMDKTNGQNPYTPAFTLLFPKNHISSPITFSVVRKDLSDEVVVPKST